MYSLRKKILYKYLFMLGTAGILLGVMCHVIPAKAESKIQIQNFASKFYIPAAAVETGDEKTAILKKLCTVTVKAYCSDGTTAKISVDWDLTSVNMQKKGIYKIQGRPSIPEGYSLAEKTELPVYTTQVSVQNPGQPEINAYYCMKSSGIFVFPWISGLDTENMEVWLRKEKGDWVNLTEKGYVICQDDGMYLGNMAMSEGNTYELAVRGRNFQTRILKFRYMTGDTLDITDYYSGNISGIHDPENIIRSVEDTEPGYTSRCMAFAMETGGDLDVFKERLTKDIILFGSTAGQYENTAENQAKAMHAVWDTSEVNVSVPGVYKITGSFQAPEGYTFAKELKVPVMTAYISVQDPAEPRLDTYYMIVRNEFLFPVVLKNFRNIKITPWIRKNDEEWQAVSDTQGELREDVFCLYRNCLEEGNTYHLTLRWEGGGTGVFSFDFNREFITNDSWIRRNFSDRDGQDFPDISQETEITSGSRENNTADEPAEGIPPLPTRKVTERVTDKWTSVSGKRLDIILKYMGNTVDFEKDGIRLAIPGEVVRRWDIEENETVQALVEKSDENSYKVKLYRGKNEISDISGSEVAIPVEEVFPEEDPETLKVTDSEGKNLETSFDKEKGILTVQTDQTGTFRVKSRRSASGKKSTVAATTVTVVIVAAGIGHRVRKRGAGN